MSRRHRLAEVVVVVDRQQITVDVSVADHHLHVGDAVNVQDELVKLLKLAGLDPVHREPAKLCPILKREEKIKREGTLKRTVAKQEEETGMSDLMLLSKPSDWHT